MSPIYVRQIHFAYIGFMLVLLQIDLIYTNLYQIVTGITGSG